MHWGTTKYAGRVRTYSKRGKPDPNSNRYHTELQVVMSNRSVSPHVPSYVSAHQTSNLPSDFPLALSLAVSNAIS